MQNTIRIFVEMKVTGNTRAPQQASEIPVRILLLFKDQRSANKLREQLTCIDLSRKTNTEVHAVFTSHKSKDELKVKEPRPPVVNQQSVVYFFECDLCDADYVGFTSRQRPSSTCRGAQTIGNPQPCERTTWKRVMLNRKEL